MCGAKPDQAVKPVAFLEVSSEFQQLHAKPASLATRDGRLTIQCAHNSQEPQQCVVLIAEWPELDATPDALAPGAHDQGWNPDRVAGQRLARRTEASSQIAQAPATGRILRLACGPDD
jgi:hypothetical protein